LAGAAGAKLIHVLTGLALALVLVSGGVGMASISSHSNPPNQPAARAAAANLDVSDPQVDEKTQLRDSDGRPLPEGAIRRIGSRKFRIEGRSDFILPTPDGKQALIHPHPAISGGAAHGLMLLDLETGLSVRTFEQSHRVAKCGSLEAIRPTVFSADGKKLYALAWAKSEKDGDGFAQWANADNPCKRVVLVWDVATGKLKDEWDLPPGDQYGSSLVGLNVSLDGKRLYVSGSVRMRVNPDRHIRGKALQTWDDAGHPAGFSAGGKELITFRRGAEITALDPETGKPARTFKLDGYIASVALSEDGKTVAAVGIAGEGDKQSCEIRLWETATGKEIRALTADPKTVGFNGRLVFAADGKVLYLAAASGRVLRGDLSKGKALPDWPVHNGMIADLFLRPGKNEIVSSGAWDGAIRCLDAATGESLSKTDAYVGQVAVARMPEGNGIVLVDENGRLETWDLTTGKVTKTLQTPGR
jgi:WD40 repeat protein